jgi:hypothetical protein
MAELREKRKQESQVLTVSPCDDALIKLTQAEAEAEANRDISPSAHAKPAARRIANKVSTGFDALWAEYPRKVGKEAAAKAFAKRCPDGPTQAAMLAAIRVQRDSQQWVRDGGQFIPHFSTWLNAGRWQDEIAPGSARGVDVFAGAM